MAIQTNLDSERSRRSIGEGPLLRRAPESISTSLSRMATRLLFPAPVRPTTPSLSPVWTTSESPARANGAPGLYLRIRPADIQSGSGSRSGRSMRQCYTKEPVAVRTSCKRPGAAGPAAEEAVEAPRPRYWSSKSLQGRAKGRPAVASVASSAQGMCCRLLPGRTLPGGRAADGTREVIELVRRMG